MEEELSNQIRELETKLEETQNKLSELKHLFETHEHSGRDGSQPIREASKFMPGESVVLGNSAWYQETHPMNNLNHLMAFVTGRDRLGAGASDKSDNTQLVVEYQENTNGGLNYSFFYSTRPPLYINSSPVSVSAGSNQITDTTKSWAINELAGASIMIFKDLAFIETKKIVSNTQNTMTLDTAFSQSSNNVIYATYVPTFLGSANTPWRRVFTEEGTDGGVRFGVGPTNQGQNGHLYMDSAGDLYWRNKSGSSTKLN